MRNKRIYPRFLHNLRKCCRISEHIRQPQNMAFHSEFISEKALTEKNLTNQTFSGSQIRIRFDPHCPFRLPASLFDSLLYFFIKFGTILFYHRIQNRLRRKKFKFRKFFHQCQNRRKRAQRLFPRLTHCPKPGDINMRMPDHTDRYGIFAAQPLIKFPLQKCRRFFYRYLISR